MFNDSYFSYSVAVKYKPSTSFGAQPNYGLFASLEHQLCVLEKWCRHQPQGVSTILLLSLTSALIHNLQL